MNKNKENIKTRQKTKQTILLLAAALTLPIQEAITSRWQDGSVWWVWFRKPHTQPLTCWPCKGQAFIEITMSEKVWSHLSHEESQDYIQLRGEFASSGIWLVFCKTGLSRYMFFFLLTQFLFLVFFFTIMLKCSSMKWKKKSKKQYNLRISCHCGICLKKNK